MVLLHLIFITPSNAQFGYSNLSPLNHDTVCVYVPVCMFVIQAFWVSVLHKSLPHCCLTPSQFHYVHAPYHVHSAVAQLHSLPLLFWNGTCSQVPWLMITLVLTLIIICLFCREFNHLVLVHVIYPITHLAIPQIVQLLKFFDLLRILHSMTKPHM